METDHRLGRFSVLEYLEVILLLDLREKSRQD